MKLIFTILFFLHSVVCFSSSEELIQLHQYDEFKKLVFYKKVNETITYLKAQSIGSHEINESTYAFLSFAASECSLKLVEYLVENGVQINTTKSFNPLFASLESGCESVSKYLVEKGANLQYMTEDGLTLLYAAASGSSLEIFTLLESRGVELFTKKQKLDNIRGALNLNKKHQDAICNYLKEQGVEFTIR